MDSYLRKQHPLLPSVLLRLLVGYERMRNGVTQIRLSDGQVVQGVVLKEFREEDEAIVDAQLNPENFFYCRICNTVSYDLKCECGGTACNGGGCDKCAEAWAAAWKAIEAGNHPPKEKMRHTPTMEDLFRWRQEEASNSP